MNAHDISLGPAMLPATLLAQMGETVAAAASQLQTRWPGMPGAAAAALAELEQLGLQAQAVVRMLTAPGGAMAERLDLGVAVLQARAEWGATVVRAGATWTGPSQACELVANPAVVKQLLDLAIAHALALGPRGASGPGRGPELAVDVVQGAEPPLVAIRIEVSRPGGELFEARPGDAAELHWALLTQLAQHAGVRAERQVRALSVELLLGWPTSSVSATRPLPEPAMLPRTAIPAGCRVLLVEPHEPTRVEAERLMLQAGLKVKSVPTVDQAQAASLHSLPDCLVTGVETVDSACALLLADLRARQPDLCVLELSRQPHLFTTSLRAAGQPARIGRDSLARTLVPALAQELGTPQ